MTRDGQTKFIGGCAAAGAVLLTIGDLAYSNFYAYRHAAELGAAGAVGSGISVGGTVFGGAIAGAFIGCLIVFVLPKEKTTCAKCGSTNAVKAYKSIWDGKEHPNRCPDCKHEWQG